MLLFCDGFEYFDVMDLWRKWGFVNFERPWSNERNAYLDPWAKIVSGMDTTRNPPQPRARHERSLMAYRWLSLGTPIQKSRTVFLGFAMRNFIQTTVRFAFLTRTHGRRLGSSDARYAFDWDRLAVQKNYTGLAWNAVCTMTIRQDRIDCIWDFPHWSLPNQYTQVMANSNLLSGDWYYFQLGFTLLGTDVNNPQGWVENRIGNRPEKSHRIENIRTTIADTTESYYINAVHVSFNNGDNGKALYLDDFYICNDEGKVNNTFLGNVSIRSVWPVAQGTVNQAQPINGTGSLRNEHVGAGDTGFICTTRSMPNPIPDPATDPDFISFTDPRSSWLRWNNLDDEQLIRFTHINYGGAEPKILGAALSYMVRASNAVGKPSELRPIIKVGDMFMEAQPMYRPPSAPNGANKGRHDSSFTFPSYYYDNANSEDIRQYGFEFGQAFFENVDNDRTVWNTTALNNAEYGFKLKEWTGNAADYAHASSRYNIKITEEIIESVSIVDWASRFFEEQMSESLMFAITESTAQWGASVDESLVLFGTPLGVRGMPCLADEYIQVQDEYPWAFPQVQTTADLVDYAELAWHMTIEETIELNSWTTPWWYEELFSQVDLEDANISTIATLVLDEFGIESSDVWDNHFDVDEDLGFIVSYVFEGHESAEEYINFDSFANNGFGADLNDEIVLTEDNFGGWWVELSNSSVNVADDVKTQQWRHIWFMGVLIQSWQIDPIEQPGATDGYRVGELDEDIFGV